MQSIFQLAFGTLGTITFVIIAHKKIGEYGKALPKSRKPKKELLEVFIMWLIIFSSTSYIIIFGPKHYPSIIIGNVKFSLHFFLVLLIPFITEVVINKRKAKELGFTLPLSWKPAFALIGFGLFFGFFAFLFEHHSTIETRTLMLGILSPSFKEEWFYRVALQSKIERALGQKKSWFYGGLLFGLAHITTDFYGPLWVASGYSIPTSLFRLIGQCAFGWLWGILYAKSRSIFPAVIGHYFSDFLPGIINNII